MKFLPLAIAALAAAPAAASDWQVDPEASSVEFTTQAFGRDVDGRFATFDADIRLDPSDLSTARIEGRVDTASGETGNPQYNSEMTGDDGLDADNHPFAVFVSESVSPGTGCAAGDGECYQADGTLTLRGNEHPATMHFRLSIEGDRAMADGELTIAREDFGIGSGNWGDAARSVEVRLHIEATR
jgi:polyisoprenoid-binding protein YceI